MERGRDIGNVHLDILYVYFGTGCTGRNDICACDQSRDDKCHCGEESKDILDAHDGGMHAGLYCLASNKVWYMRRKSFATCAVAV